ncbi:unnamed protein product [Paramecium pentaurelia]|uniref:RING-type E3 ubiquitin transferase n=1 Tax=Paramecium pentaurelia TaxID=43138 RepID=A0A8S1T6S3_9CILI|nr:unnamed protein product [Paramecium pentaurelia]
MEILSGKDYILKVSNDIDDYEDEELILAILNITSDEYMNTIVKLKGYGQKNLCANIIEESEMFYQCFDCSKDINQAICRECFIPKNHKNHAVFLEQIQSEMPGYCDCGDTMIFETGSICPQHNHFQQKFKNVQLGYDKVIKKYEQFLMIAFGLLQKKFELIVDYPNDLLKNIENIIESLNDDILKNYLNSHKIHFQLIQDSINQAKQIHKLILKCLEIITTDNIVWSSLTAKILKQEFKCKIQDNTIGSISLLEYYIKYSAHLFGSLKFEQDISIFFPLFFQEDEFRTHLVKIVIQNFQRLYLLIHSYKLTTIKNEEFQFQIYQEINDQKLAILIQQILACNQIQQIVSENIIIKSKIAEKFYFFIQRGYIEILKLYQNIKTPICYNLFDNISDMLLKIQLTNYASLEFTETICCFLEMMGRCKKGLKGLVNQIHEILSIDIHSFQSQILNPNSQGFQKLLNQSLLIYSLTRRNPCQQMNKSNLESHLNEEDELSTNYLLILLITNLSSFRCDLKSMMLAIGDLNSYEVQNIQRIILHYYLNSLVTVFNLKYQSSLQLILSNLVLSDRNFITVLSIYLMNFSNSKQAYDDILEISGQNSKQLRLIMGHILKRAILNYLIVLDNIYYQGKQNLLKDLEDEVSLQKVDLAYIQIYAFLFQEQGINDIIQFYIEIASHLKQNRNSGLLICTIAQTDNDLIQCVGNIIGNQLNIQLQKGLHKLFQTIFYSQTFYQLNEMKSILKSFINESFKDFESLILYSCERNQDNGQLQLKKEIKLPIYEPIYASQNQEIKDKINDKLQMQNDKFAELFGSSLQYELQYYNTDKSTLTNIRYEILKAISNDNQQYLLNSILNDLQNTFQSNLEYNIIVNQSIKILQENAIYINLLILSNSFFKSSNIIIQQRLDKILHYCQTILSNQKINNTQKYFFQVYCSRLENQNLIQKLDEVNHHQQQQSKSQKHQQYKQQLQLKFNQMKNNFNNKINNNEQPIEEIDEKCLLCKLPFEKEDQQYLPILIQYTNIYQYLHIFQIQPTKEINILSVHVSNCNHIFHAECLKQQINTFNDKNLKFFQCPFCHSPYNFMLPYSNKSQYIEIQQFQFSIEAFLESLFNNNLEIFEKNFDNQEFDGYQFLDIILSQILCNLTFQLLSDLENFIQKNQHLFIQKIIDQMRSLYKNSVSNLIENIKLNETEMLFQILKLIYTHLIKEHNIYNFQQKLSILLNPNFELAKILFVVFTQRKINIQINNRLLPYDIQIIKDQFKKELFNVLTNNYGSFLDQNYLLPCQKKNCQFPKLKLESKFQGQYICLICFKKMCPGYCGKLKHHNLGNVYRHSQKKHFRKCVFLDIEKSQVLLIYSPFYQIMPNTLFTDKIGDSPIKGPYPMQHYKKFQLNMKTLDQIFEIIIEEKYINKFLEI